jgi:murein DD-endopeptidase MepM/ murein hydrolase activator NlpD
LGKYRQYFDRGVKRATIIAMRRKTGPRVSLSALNRALAAFLWLLPAFSAATVLSIASVRPDTDVRGGENTLQFTHKERSLQPGEVVLYDIRSAKPLKNLQISVFDRKFRAFSEKKGTRWTALVGIDLSAKPGRYDIRLQGTGINGLRVSASDVLVVRTKKFPTRKLTVPPKYVTPSKVDQERIRRERELVDTIFEAVTPERLWKGPFHVPVPGEVISEFGKRSVYNGQPRSPHSGTDFRGAIGTPIHAPNSGRIVLTDDLYYTGKTVIIDHGLGLYSYLGHMSAITVPNGDLVQTGDLVGEVGATGRVTGPHLHWTVRLGISRVDPLSLVYVLENSR